MMDLCERSPVCCMTSGDIARLLGVDLKTIHNWVRHGHLRGRRTKGRHLRFHRTEVVRFMRRFGYAIPESLGLTVPRVLLVGLSVTATMGVRSLKDCVRVENYEGLFDAALVLAVGDYEVLAIEIDHFGIGHVVDLVAALRRRPVTQGVAIVGRSGHSEARERFVDAGGDVVIESGAELAATVRWLVGATMPYVHEHAMAAAAH
ncbi:MAG: helix-turn-helix domain-containing protein [Polyangiaceae bacterium]|nr:helix-turn-helix domain-containing protein [Polyangiaceae bacterium]